MERYVRLTPMGEIYYKSFSAGFSAEESNLNPYQFNALMEIGDHGVIEQTELGMILKDPQINQIVNSLVNRGNQALVEVVSVGN